MSDDDEMVKCTVVKPSKSQLSKTIKEMVKEYEAEDKLTEITPKIFRREAEKRLGLVEGTLDPQKKEVTRK